MKIIIAPDKFKGSLTAAEVANAVEIGIRTIYPAAEVVKVPLADGGEQTADILTAATGGQLVNITVQDPLFRPVATTYGLSADGQTAFIEMATASGLPLLTHDERNPLLTSTIGTGELILDALNRGVTDIVLCIGGSATNDAGIGMAHALGYRFLGQDGEELPPVGGSLNLIKYIDDQSVTPLLKSIHVTVACDVTNPLYGPVGAAHIYAPQKGATPTIVAELDSGLRHFARVFEMGRGVDLQKIPGGGAAGGLGAGCVAFLNAQLKPGIETVLDAVGFDAHLPGTDLIFTGEGKMDEQTLAGKVVAGVAARARVHGIPVVALCGTLALTATQVRELGVDYATSVLNRPATLTEIIPETAALIQDQAERIVQFYHNLR